MRLTRVVNKLACGLLLSASLVFAQTSTANQKPVDRSSSYYHFSMAHLYEQMAREYRSMDYINKAIDEYKLAIAADPSSDYVTSELVDLYAQAGRLNDAVSEAEAVLQRDPNNLQMRKALGRIYRGYLADPAQSKLNEDMLKRAVEQYEKIVELDPKDSESYLHLANLYRVGRDSVKAEKAYKAALAIDANSEEALTGLAALYAEIGDANGAIEMLAQAAQKRPNARILAALGAAYEQGNKPEQAIEAYTKAIDLDKTDIEARRALAHALLANEQYDKALAQYQALAQADPQDPTNFLRIAQIYRQRRSFSQARANIQKAASLAPGDMVEVPYEEVLLLEAEGKLEQAAAAVQKLIDGSAKANASEYSQQDRRNRAFFFEKLGQIERLRENYPSAEKAFRAMGEADPETATRASIQVIETYRAARDFKRAVAEADAAAKKFPKDRPVALERASVLAENGEAKQGAQIIRGMMKDGPEDADLHLQLAQIYEKGKLFNEAKESIDKAQTYAQSKEQKRVIYFSYGALAERQKKYDEAERQFRLALEIDPRDSGTLNYLGYMLADQNRKIDEAYTMVKTAIEIEPENGAYLDSLGWVYYRQKKFDLAEELLLRAIQKTPSDPTVHEHLGDIYMAQGKTKLAQEQWQLSLREWDQSAKSEFDPDDVAKLRKKLDAVKLRLAQEQGGKR